MKNGLTLILILCISSFISAQEKVIREDWYNGSLKKHLILRGSDTLYFEYGYENGQPAIKRWGRDSLFTYNYEGEILKKMYRTAYSNPYSTFDSIVILDTEFVTNTMFLKDSNTRYSYTYDKNQLCYTMKSYGTMYECRDRYGVILAKGRHRVFGESIADTIFYNNGTPKWIRSLKSYKTYKENGELLHELIYDELISEKDNVECLYGFKDKNDAWVISPQYENIQKLGSDYWVVSKPDSAFILNHKGEKLLNTHFEFLDILDLNSHKNTAIYSYEKRTEPYIFSEYQRFLNVLQSDKGILLKFRKNGQYGVVDMKGNIILPPVYQNVRKYDVDVFEVQMNNKWGIVDSTGKILINPQYDELKFTLDPHVFISVKELKKGGTTVFLHGLESTQNKTLTDCIYSNITDLGKGNFYLDFNNKGYLFNAKTGFVVDTNYSLIGDNISNNKYYTVKTPKGLYGLVDREGKVLIPIEYKQIKSIFYPRGMIHPPLVIVVKQNGKEGIWDIENNRWIIESNAESVFIMPYLMAHSNDSLLQAHGIYNYGRAINIAVKRKKQWQFYSVDGTLSDKKSFDYLGELRLNESINKGLFFSVKDKILSIYSVESFPLKTDYSTFKDIKHGSFLSLTTYEGDNLLFNLKGELLTSDRYKVKSVLGDYAILEEKRSKKQVLLNVDGTMKDFLPSYQVLQADIKSGVVVVASRQTGLVGCVNLEGQEIIPIKNFVAFISEKDACIWVRSDFPKLPKDSIIYYDNMLYSALDSNWQLYSMSGKRLSSQIFDLPFEFNNNVGVGGVGRKWGLWRSDGTELLPPQYRYILRDTIDGIHYIMKEWADSSWTYGFTDTQGKIVQEANFKMMSRFFSNYAMVLLSNGQKGVISKTGEWLCNPERNTILNFKGNLVDSFRQNFTNIRINPLNSSCSPKTQSIFASYWDSRMPDGFSWELYPFGKKCLYFDSLTVEKQRVLTNCLVNVSISSGYSLPNQNTAISLLSIKRISSNLGLSPLFKNKIYTAPNDYNLSYLNRINRSPIYGASRFDRMSISDFKMDDKFVNIAYMGAPFLSNIYTFNAYGRNGTWRSVEIEDFLSLTTSNIESINRLLIQKIKNLKKVELNCDNGKSFFEEGRQLVYLSKEGVIFHFISGNIRHYLTDKNFVPVLLTWDELQPFLKLRP